ncbi:YraN family protein [bacterium]|nr:YraN family protein [bacterium]
MKWLTRRFEGHREVAGDRAATGRRGEKAAAAYLKSQGYTIVERNLTLPGGEIDLIARDDDTLVIVEVKALADPEDGFDPIIRVNKDKRERLVRLADAYCRARRLTDTPVRFDVVGVVFQGKDTVVRHFPRAFDAQGRRL